MNKIIAIALNTFRESIRDRIFYSLLVFAVLMLGFSTVLGNLTIGQPDKIIKDFGLGAISIFGTLIAIFVGIGLVYKEMEKKTIYLILTKPLSRWQFLLGKYIGLSMTIFVEVAVMSICLFGLLHFYYGLAMPWELIKAILPICFELQLILATALLFSTFASPFLSSLFTLSIFVIGHLTQDLQVLAQNSDDVGLKRLSMFLYYLFPNLEFLNFKTQVVHGLPIPTNALLLSLLYAAVYTVALLIAGIIVFSKRDIR